MTVLEKIKRCVSLVWDFQETYGEEDIEDFCSNELRTYSQHDEIMKYFKQIETLEEEKCELLGIIQGKDKAIAELEKENAELKDELKRWKDEWQEQVQKATDEGYARTLQTIQLNKAKELLAKWVELFKPKGGNIPPTPIQIDTEQFLNSEVEKINSTKELCRKLVGGIKLPLDYKVESADVDMQKQSNL